MRALLRSPLLHFVSLGALVYVAQAVTQAPPADPQTAFEIELEASVLAELDRRFSETMGRGPSPEERDRMIAAEVEEEILFREAVARGLLERADGHCRLTESGLLLANEVLAEVI